MMGYTICNGCGGVIGRDCYNPRECEEITRSLANDALNDRTHEELSQYKELNAELLEGLKFILTIEEKERKLPESVISILCKQLITKAEQSNLVTK